MTFFKSVVRLFLLFVIFHLLTIPGLQRWEGFKYTTSGFGVNSDVNLYPGDSFMNSNLLKFCNPETRLSKPQ